MPKQSNSPQSAQAESPKPNKPNKLFTHKGKDGKTRGVSFGFQQRQIVLTFVEVDYNGNEVITEKIWKRLLQKKNQ